jgi:adenine-specific DNA-methyltransferase
VSDLKKIPITNKLSDVKSSLLTLVELIMHVDYANNKLIFHLFDEIIDGIAFELYFPDHMKEKQIDILQFVEKDLADVMKGRDFEQLPDSEKETVINQLHARWTHPDSEVRNRIKLFAVRSPDILKPILESR